MSEAYTFKYFRLTAQIQVQCEMAEINIADKA